MAGKFILKAAANTAALWAGTRFIPGFEISIIPILSLQAPIAPFWTTLAGGGIALAIPNFLLRPILKVTGAILPLISFAFLSLALNAALLYLADSYFAELTISGFKAFGLAALLIGAVNAAF